METYRVRVTKDYLAFSAAHFIVFNGTQCERLHGHNYRVAAELEAELDEDFLVFDFIELKRMLRGITNELDHRLLVPLKSNRMTVDPGERAVRIAYQDREWIVPRGDCALLPIENTTAELLARHIAERLTESLEAKGLRLDGPGRLHRLRLEVEESPGQSAVFEFDSGLRSSPA